MKWTWDLDPVAFSIFGLEVRWYGMVYVFGFFLTLHWGWRLWREANPPSKIKKESFENLIFGGFLFGVLGGRIGHFLFYDPSTFLYDFFEILKLWHGGMSIHGGILGAVAFLYYWSRKQKASFLRLADILVLPLVLVLFLGRGANFVNGELVGTLTDQSWGVIFPHIDDQLRHPSQLYGMGKDLILFGLLFYGFRQKWHHHSGMLSSVFLIGYGVIRFIVEFFKVSAPVFLGLTTGQVLCVFMVITGVGVLYSSLKKNGS